MLGIRIGEGNYQDEVEVVANLKKPLAIVHGEKDGLASLSYLKGVNIPTLWRATRPSGSSRSSLTAC